MKPPTTLTVPSTATAPALTLRSWQESDIPALLAAHQDEAMRRWLVGHPRTEADARAWLAKQQTGWTDGTHFSWAVQEAEHGALVGYFVLKAANPPETRATGVGYWTTAEARGRGVASRCVEAVTAWLFGGQTLLPAEEVELIHTVGNEGACRVAQKTGYALDSVLPPFPPQFPAPGHRHIRRRPA